MYLSAETIAKMEGVRRVHALNSAANRIDKSLGDEAGLKNHRNSSDHGGARETSSTEFHTPSTKKKRFTCCRVMGRGHRATNQKIGPGDFIGFAGGRSRRMRR